MKLFQPYQLKKQILQNRIVVAPMCQYSSIDGVATPWHLMHYGQFAAGKAGLIIQEATAVSPEGRITFADMGIWNDIQAESLQPIIDFVHQQSVPIGIQLAHAGRKASTNIPWINRNQFHPNHEKGWQTIAPSPIGYHAKDALPTEMSTTDINKTIQDFKKASERAVAIGYDVIEIHAAHGYLFHQFLSPLTNKRTDQYGGCLENRARLLIKVVETIQKTLHHQSLWVRISATDWAENGWNIQESITLCKILKNLGVEVIDVSTGGAVSHQQIPTAPNYQVPFSQQIKEEVEIPTATVGLITSGKQAETILQHNQADLIAVGRGFLQNPHLAYEWAKELQYDLEWQPQYARGKESYI